MLTTLPESGEKKSLKEFLQDGWMEKKKGSEKKRWQALPRGPDSGQDDGATTNKTSATIAEREKQTEKKRQIWDERGKSGVNGEDTNRVKDIAAHVQSAGTEGMSELATLAASWVDGCLSRLLANGTKQDSCPLFSQTALYTLGSRVRPGID